MLAPIPDTAPNKLETPPATPLTTSPIVSPTAVTAFPTVDVISATAPDNPDTGEESLTVVTSGAFVEVVAPAVSVVNVEPSSYVVVELPSS